MIATTEGEPKYMAQIKDLPDAKVIVTGSDTILPAADRVKPGLPEKLSAIGGDEKSYESPEVAATPKVAF
jgi:hypothetical protein